MDENKKKILQMERKLKSKLNVEISDKSLFRYADWQDWAYLLTGNIISLAGGVALPFFWLFLGSLMQSLNADLLDDNKVLIYWSFLVAGIMIVVFGWLYIALVKVKNTMLRKVRIALFRALLNRDWKFYAEFKPQEVSQFIENEITYYEKGINEKIGTLWISVALTLSGLVISFYLSPRFTGSLMAFLVLIMSVMILCSRQIFKHSEVRSENSKYLGGVLEEIFYSIKTIYYLDAQDWALKRFEKFNNKCCDAGVNMWFFTALMIGGFQFLFWGYMIVGSYIANGMAEDGELDRGDSISIIFIVIAITSSLSGVAMMIKDIIEARLHVVNIYFFIDYQNELADRPSSCRRNLDNLRIDTADLQFKYNTSEDALTLDSINVEILPGKVTSFVGQSGSGKSTLIKLLTRFYDCTAGSVKWNGHDVKDIDVRQLRESIGYVSQDPVFFNLSLRDNMRVVDEHVTDAAIMDSLKRVHLVEWFNTLKEGLDTVLGNQGEKLSGGQKQRLALARVFLKKTLRLLVLDEATSALDYSTEKKIYKTIFENQKELNLTCVIIAHRLKSIKHSDRIYVLHNGIQKEFGTHDELLQNQKLYASLMNSQENRGDSKEVADGNKEDEEEVAVVNQVKSQDIAEVTPKDFSILDFTWQMIEANPDTRWILVLGTVLGCLRGVLIGTFGYWLASLFIMVLTPPAQQTTAENNRIYTGLALYAFGLSVCEFVRLYSLNYYSETAMTRLKTHILRNILQYKLVHLEKQEFSPGNVAFLFSSQIEILRSASGEYILELISCFFSITAGIAFSAWFEYRITLIMCGCMPVIIWSMSGDYMEMRRSNLKIGLKGSEKMKKDAMLMSESVLNWMTTQSLCGEDYLCRQYDSLVAEEDLPIGTMLYKGFRFGTAYACFFFAMAVLFYSMMEILKSDSTASFKDLFIAMMLVAFGTMTLLNAFAIMPDISRGIEAARKLQEMTENPEYKKSETGTKVCSELGDIEFKNIKFQYNEDSKVFDGLDFKIEQNKFNAICGYSGGGKSTLLNLMLKLYIPTSGQILINGEDIDVYQTSSILSLVGYVGQDSVVFDETIEDNINIGMHAHIKPEALQSLMSSVNASDFYNVHDNESITRKIGLKGINISGGQRQRLALARALARNNLQPKLLILDEATAALDGKNEEEIQKILNKILEQKNCTIIMVAHRLSTIRNADVINVLSAGKLMERGSHDELIQKDGIYKSMINI